MKPTIKICLKPKYKIGSMVWMLNYNVSIMDYILYPSDDKLRSEKVVSYKILYENGKANITSYIFADGHSDSGKYNWSFSTKKELKEYLKGMAIARYKSRSGTMPNMENFVLTAEERILLKL